MAIRPDLVAQMTPEERAEYERNQMQFGYGLQGFGVNPGDQQIGSSDPYREFDRGLGFGGSMPNPYQQQGSPMSYDPAQANGTASFDINGQLMQESQQFVADNSSGEAASLTQPGFSQAGRVKAAPEEVSYVDADDATFNSPGSQLGGDPNAPEPPEPEINIGTPPPSGSRHGTGNMFEDIAKDIGGGVSESSESVVDGLSGAYQGIKQGLGDVWDDPSARRQISSIAKLGATSDPVYGLEAVENMIMAISGNEDEELKYTPMISAMYGDSGALGGDWNDFDWKSLTSIFGSGGDAGSENSLLSNIFGEGSNMGFMDSLGSLFGGDSGGGGGDGGFDWGSLAQLGIGLGSQYMSDQAAGDARDSILDATNASIAAGEASEQRAQDFIQEGRTDALTSLQDQFAPSQYQLELGSGQAINALSQGVTRAENALQGGVDQFGATVGTGFAQARDVSSDATRDALGMIGRGTDASNQALAGGLQSALGELQGSNALQPYSEAGQSSLANLVDAATNPNSASADRRASRAQELLNRQLSASGNLGQDSGAGIEAQRRLALELSDREEDRRVDLSRELANLGASTAGQQFGGDQSLASARAGIISDVIGRQAEGTRGAGLAGSNVIERGAGRDVGLYTDPAEQIGEAQLNQGNTLAQLHAGLGSDTAGVYADRGSALSQLLSGYGSNRANVQTGSATQGSDAALRVGGSLADILSGSGGELAQVYAGQDRARQQNLQNLLEAYS